MKDSIPHIAPHYAVYSG